MNLVQLVGSVGEKIKIKITIILNPVASTSCTDGGAQPNKKQDAAPIFMPVQLLLYVTKLYHLLIKKTLATPKN